MLIEKVRYYLFENNTIGQTIFKNTFWLSSAEFLKSVILVLIYIILARELGVSEYGVFSFVWSFVGLFIFIANFGLPTFVLREVSRDKQSVNKIFNNVLFVKLILAVAAFVLIALSAEFVVADNSTKFLIYLASINIITNTFIGFSRSFFRAFEKMQWEAFSKILEIFLLALSILYFVVIRDGNLREIFYGYVVVGLVVASVNFFVLSRKILKSKLLKDVIWDSEEMKIILKSSLPLVFSAVFTSIYYNIDQVMIGTISTKEDLGYYSAAYRIAHGLSMFYTILLTSFSPRISYFFKNNSKELLSLLKKMNKIIAVISIPMGIGGTFLSFEIISSIFGDEYTKSVFVFQILIWAQLIAFVGICYGNTLVMCDRQKKFLYGAGSGAIINIILNFILIPGFSLYGAAIATLVTQILIFVYMYQVLNTEILKVSFYKYLAKPVLASLVMVLFLSLTRNSFNIFILILVGALIYLLSLFKIFRFKL